VPHPIETWEREIQRSQRRVDAQRASKPPHDPWVEFVKLGVRVVIVLALLIALTYLVVGRVG